MDRRKRELRVLGRPISHPQDHGKLALSIAGEHTQVISVSAERIEQDASLGCMGVGVRRDYNHPHVCVRDGSSFLQMWEEELSQ